MMQMKSSPQVQLQRLPRARSVGLFGVVGCMGLISERGRMLLGETEAA
jgi:hypothetical protein